jgi:hypothetical protein
VTGTNSGNGCDCALQLAEARAAEVVHGNEAAAIAVRTAIMLIQEADPYAFGAVYSPRS